MVLRRIMRIWANRFSASAISTPLRLMRMMVWWNSMFTSEYSSSRACSSPSSKVVNILRSVAISSDLAFVVMRRAAMLSSAAQAVIISITCCLLLRTT